jgi:hypothetical protein
MGKIYKFEELEDFVSKNENWRLTINIIDIWNQYQEKKITVEQFNKAYADRLTQYQSSINELGPEAWSSIEQLIPKLTSTNELNESINLYDDIYDWGDKNDVLIQTK